MNLAPAQQALQLLLVAALYAFLAAVLVFLWRDERRAASGAHAPPPAHLVRRGPPPQAVFPLTSSTLIGRAADNAIRLDDPLISAYHARVSFAGGQWLVEDLGSRNGTQVNEVVVEGAIVLAAGDVLRIGGTSLEFSATAPPGAAESNAARAVPAEPNLAAD